MALDECPDDYFRVNSGDQWDLNGDLNEGAGGKDIFLCYSKAPKRGRPITEIAVTDGGCPGGFSRVRQVNGSNGDLNQSAGGKDIFVCISRQHKSKPVANLFLAESPECGSSMVDTSRTHGGLNGDLNQGSGGEDIFLCLDRRAENMDEDRQALVHDVVVSLDRCPSGYRIARGVTGGLNGDANEGSGGETIYVCTSTDARKGAPINGIALTEDRNGWCPSGYSRVRRTNGSNGDLNEDAGGKFIFMCARRGETNPIQAIFLSEEESCGGSSDSPKLTHDLNGDLNQSAGGKDVFVCLERAIDPSIDLDAFKPELPIDERYVFQVFSSHSAFQ